MIRGRAVAEKFDPMRIYESKKFPFVCAEE